MKKRLKITGAAVSLAFALMAFPTAYAEDVTVSQDYDPSKTGSITIYKYVTNDGGSFESDGTVLNPDSDDQLDAVQDAAGNYRMLPEEGVSFKYLKIADAISVEKDDGTGTSFYFCDLDSAFYELVTATYGIELTEAGEYPGSGYFAPQDVKDAMMELVEQPANANSEYTAETALREYLKTAGTDFAEPTNEFGKTTASNLPTGLYLVAEVNWEHQAISKHDTYWERVDIENGTSEGGEGSEYADIASPSSPFLVQLPITNVGELTVGNTTYEPGTVWQYDIAAYPKNGTISIHKDIVVNDYAEDSVDNNDRLETETLCDYVKTNSVTGGTPVDGTETSGLTHQIDANIGDTITQVISVDVPVLLGNRYITEFSVTDLMTKGLQFSRVIDIRYGAYAWNDSRNVRVTSHYFSLNISDDGSQFTVDVTNRNIFNGAEQKYFYIIFESVLTDDALIGTDTYEYTTDENEVIQAGNQDTARLDFSTDRTAAHSYYSNTPHVYTYEIDLLKDLPDSNADYSSVVYSATGSTTPVSDDAGTDTEEQMLWTLESAGIYHVYCTETDGQYDKSTDLLENAVGNYTAGKVTRYVIPDSNGNVVLKGVDSRDYVFTEEHTAAGSNLLAEPFSFRLVANKIEDELPTKNEDGTLLHAYVWSGSEPKNIEQTDLALSGSAALLERGRAKAVIQNDSGITLLRTGGTGTLIYILVGAAVMAVGVGAILFQKNRTSEKEADEGGEE